MKTVFDKTTREELIGRINLLNENSKAQWGKMNVYQMLKHCTLWEQWVRRTEKNKQIFLGKLFGRMALKGLTKNENPIKKRSPTLPELMIKENTGDIAAEKKKWVGAIESYANFSNPGFVHTFFGELSHQQIGILAYKHSDHHLRQFNC